MFGVWGGFFEGVKMVFIRVFFFIFIGEVEVVIVVVFMIMSLFVFKRDYVRDIGFMVGFI